MALRENTGAANYKQLVGKAETNVDRNTDTIHCLALLPSSGTLSGSLSFCNLENSTEPDRARNTSPTQGKHNLNST